MSLLLYVLLGIAIIVAGVFGWFFLIYLRTPKLTFPPGASDQDIVDSIDTWLRGLQEQNKFNGVVLLAKEGRALLARGYGFTNYQRTTPLTEYSSLRLASVSKQFTAAGIMVQKTQGKLDYDDPVAKYIMHFPYQDVTIRHLLNQTSGIPDIYLQLAQRKKTEIKVLTNEMAVDLLVQEKRRRKSAPNERYQYSNTNYILLARLIEITSGLSFEEFMQREVFDPLGMRNTRVWNLISGDETFEHKADDFENFNNNITEIKPTFVDGVAGDGGVFSSAADMLLWDQFWYGSNSLVDDRNLQEAFKRPTLANGKRSDYGFGWLITENGMWHNGAWLGANTMIIRNTAEKICIVILDNSSSHFVDKIAKALRSALIGRTA